MCPKEVFFKKITFLHTCLNNNLLFFWTFWHTVALGKYEQNVTNFKKCYLENIIILRCQLWYSIIAVSLGFHFDRYKVYLHRIESEDWFLLNTSIWVQNIYVLSDAAKCSWKYDNCSNQYCSILFWCNLSHIILPFLI